MDPLEVSTESNGSISTVESNNGGPGKERVERFVTRDFRGMRIGGAAESNSGEQRKEKEKPCARRHCPPGMRIQGAIPMLQQRKVIAKKRTDNSEVDPGAHVPSDCESSIDTQTSTSRRPNKSFKKEANGVVVPQRSYRQ